MEGSSHVGANMEGREGSKLQLGVGGQVERPGRVGGGNELSNLTSCINAEGR